MSEHCSSLNWPSDSRQVIITGHKCICSMSKLTLWNTDDGIGGAQGSKVKDFCCGHISGLKMGQGSFVAATPCDGTMM